MLHSTVHVVLTDLTTPDLPLMDKDDAVQYVTYESYSQEGGISFIQSLLNQRLINVDSSIFLSSSSSFFHRLIIFDTDSNGSVEVVFIEQSETYPEIFNIMMKKFGTNQTFNIDSTTNYRKGNTVVFSPVDPNQDYIMFTYNGPKQVRVDVIHSSTQDVVISFLRGDFGNPT